MNMLLKMGILNKNVNGSVVENIVNSLTYKNQ